MKVPVIRKISSSTNVTHSNGNIIISLFNISLKFIKTFLLSTSFWMPDDHLRLIGKCVVYFLLVLIELIFTRCYSWGARANIDWKSAISLQRCSFDPKFQVEKVAPTNHSSSQKTSLNDLLYGIKIWTDVSSVLSQFKRLTERRTDRIPCSVVKTNNSKLFTAGSFQWQHRQI